MKVNDTYVLRRSFHTVLGSLLLVLFLCSCSLSGTSTSTTTQPASTSTSKPIPTQSPQHPIANQPPGAGNSGGTPLPSNEVKPLAFNLIYNDAAMEHDISQIYQPGSPSFHHYLTTEQIVQRYTLSDSQLQQVKTWLTQQGYTIVAVDPLRSTIQVQGTVATIQNSLHIKLNAYTFLNRQFFMQQGTPVLPPTIASLVQSIVGLNNFALPEFQPPFGLAIQAPQDAMAGNCTKYGAKQTLTSKKLASAYQLDRFHQQNILGQGTAIGIAEFGEPYDPADIAQYAACAGIPTPHIQNIDIDGHVAAGPGEGEAAMDVELAAALAPQAQILVYQASLDNTSFAQALVDVLNRVATDHRVQVLSISYGTGEFMFSSTEQAAINRSLRTLAAEGISVFISSGDCGAYSQRVHNVAMVSFPASAPYAIAVGGTHLQVNDNNVRVSETGWGDDNGAPACQNEWGSGGGVSQNDAFRRPSWQTGPGTTNQYDGTLSGVLAATIPPTPLSAPNGLRQVPDISAAAYPNIAIYYKGSWLAAGGTSASAPIVAAGTALVDQALQQHGKGWVGSVPEWYTLANHARNLHPYNDITSGNNLFYPAVRGWDYVTGWGSPNFYDILQLELAE
jgi:subtilase family serine protease